ncbi:hypothetical protein CapIbe_018289 [Capra ibex]
MPWLNKPNAHPGHQAAQHGWNLALLPLALDRLLLLDVCAFRSTWRVTDLKENNTGSRPGPRDSLANRGQMGTGILLVSDSDPPLWAARVALGGGGL